MERAYRARRSCLAVPASSERFIEKARGLPADEVFLDLEDAVAPAAKAQARANAAAAVNGDWGGRLARSGSTTRPLSHGLAAAEGGATMTALENSRLFFPRIAVRGSVAREVGGRATPASR